MNNIFMLRATLAGALLLTAIAGQAQTYSYQRVGPAAPYFTYANGISDTGEVAGSYTDTVTFVRGWTAADGTYTVVDVPGNPQSELTAIHGRNLYGSADEGFQYNTADGEVDYVFPRVAGEAIVATPLGVSSNSIVVGTYTNELNPNVIYGAFTFANGKYTTYAVPGSSNTSFTGVNARGVIVGTFLPPSSGPSESFKLVDGKRSTILFPGSYQTTVTGINNAGETIGYYQATSGAALTMFLYDGTKYTALPNPPNAVGCSTGSINNSGSFVATCYDPSTSTYVGILATLESAEK